eukprot:SM000113S24094  [mRNA]  locus=s113:305894:309907:- [translate_table: standard]
MVAEPRASDEVVGGGAASTSSKEEDNDSDSDDDASSSDDRTGGAASPPGGSPQSQLVAVACDDGCVRLFAAEEGLPGLVYRRAFPRVKGRILSVAWNATASQIFAGGSDGCIRCWDVAGAREVYRITAGLGGAGAPAHDLCIWSLLVLRDGTVVSGDSAGATQFWDGSLGTLLQAQTRHRADVLALAASPSQAAVFSGGVDGQVVMYQRLGTGLSTAGDRVSGGATTSAPSDAAAAAGRAGPWAYVGARRSHSHDVRALCVAAAPAEEGGVQEVRQQGLPRKRRRRRPAAAVEMRGGGRWRQSGTPMLVSGGADAQLLTYPATAFLDFYPHHVCAAPQRPPMQLATAGPNGQLLLLAQHARSVEVWQLQPGIKASLPLRQTSLQVAVGGPAAAIAAPQANGFASPRKKAKLAAAMAAAHHSGTACNGPTSLSHGKRGGEQAPDAGKTATRPPRKVVVIKPGEGCLHLACSAISADGRHVALSDAAKPRLYELTSTGAATGQVVGRHQPGETCLSSGLSSVGQGDALRWSVRRRHLPTRLPAAHAVAFSGDSSKLLLAAKQGNIVVVDLETCEELHHFAPSSARSAMELDGAVPAVRMMSVSADGQWLATAVAGGRTNVYNLDRLRVTVSASHALIIALDRHHWELPVLDSGLPMALAFHPSSDVLVVGTSVNRVHVLDVEARQLAAWSKESGSRLPRSLLELPGGISGLSLPPAPDANSIIAYSSRAMCHINLNLPVPDSSTPHPEHPSASTSTPNGSVEHLDGGTLHVAGEPGSLAGNQVRRKRQRKSGAAEESKDAERTGESKFSVVALADPCLFLAHTSTSSILVVEKPWADVLLQLPPPLYRHKFGT